MHHARPFLPFRRWSVPGVVVAGGALAVFAVVRTMTEPREEPPPAGRMGEPGSPSERWMKDLLDHHAAERAGLPPAPLDSRSDISGQPVTARSSRLRGLELRVGVPVRIAPLERLGARWVGADVIEWDSRSAALLQYRLRRHRVTVYVYDSDQTPLRTLETLHPRAVGSAVVFVGQSRGYSVAVVENAGLGHAVVTDLPVAECAELVVAMRVD